MPINFLQAIHATARTASRALTLKLSNVANAWHALPKADRTEIISTIAIFAILILMLVTAP